MQAGWYSNILWTHCLEQKLLKRRKMRQNCSKLFYTIKISHLRSFCTRWEFITIYQLWSHLKKVPIHIRRLICLTLHENVKVKPHSATFNYCLLYELATEMNKRTNGLLAFRAARDGRTAVGRRKTGQRRHSLATWYHSEWLPALTTRQTDGRNALVSSFLAPTHHS